MMITREQLLEFNSAQLMEVFIKLYAYEYGEKKIHDIENRISKSEKLNQLLLASINKMQLQSAMNIFNGVSAIPYFGFAKGETVCLGAIIFIDNCKKEIASRSNNDLFLLKVERDKSNLILDIVTECIGLKFGIGANFFDRYFKQLANYYYARK